MFELIFLLGVVGTVIPNCNIVSRTDRFRSLLYEPLVLKSVSF